MKDPINSADCLPLYPYCFYQALPRHDSFTWQPLEELTWFYTLFIIRLLVTLELPTYSESLFEEQKVSILYLP